MPRASRRTLCGAKPKKEGRWRMPRRRDTLKCMASHGGWRGALLGVLWLVYGCDLASASVGVGAGAGGLGGALQGGGAPSATGAVSGAGTAGQGVNGGAGNAAAGAANAGAAGTAVPVAGKLRDFLGEPAFPDSFWQPASASEGQVDPAPLEQALRLIESSGWEIHSFLIAKNGRLSFERYGWNTGTNPADPNKLPHQVLPSERQLQFSTTKSFLSALVGVALSEGALS